jgi:Tol biopolymer transport system component
MYRVASIVTFVGLALLAGGWSGATGRNAPTGQVAWSDGKQVVVTKLDGALVRRIDTRGQASHRLSPDGRSLAVVDGSLRIVNLASGAAREIVAADTVDGTLSSARFSANGRYVAVSYGDESCRGGLPGIVVVDLVTSTRTEPLLWPQAKPWTPGSATRFVGVLDVTDRGTVAFHESRYTFGECRYQDLRAEAVWRSPGTTKDPIRIVTDPEIGDVAWSADRRRFAYTIGAGDACELWVANARGRNAKLIAERNYVRYGCSRGLSGIPVMWSANGAVLYYADGSEVWAWDRASNRHRALARPPGAPTSNCELDQSCLDHDLIARSSDGAWLLLAQEHPRTYRDSLYLVSTKDGAVRTVNGPTPKFEFVSARLD